jgi:hypothetical protein
VPPNFSTVMQLVQLPPVRDDADSGRIIVEHLPSRAGIPRTRSSGIPPNFATVVQLVQLASSGDANARTVIVQHLPPRAGIPAARRPGITPNCADA